MFNRAVYLVSSDVIVLYLEELVFIIATAAFFHCLYHSFPFPPVLMKGLLISAFHNNKTALS